MESTLVHFAGPRLTCRTRHAELLILCARIGFNP
jgi:hypothetical protein